MKKILTSRRTVIDLDVTKILAVMDCRDDPIYFIENYVKIEHPVQGLIPLALFEYQKEYVRALHVNDSTIAKMGRQLGKTSVTLAYMLWAAIFRPNTMAVFMSGKHDMARDALQRLQIMVEYLPVWLNPGVTAMNKGLIRFTNGSSIRARGASEDVLRGLSLSIVVLDEFAFWPERIQDLMFSAVLPCLPNGAKLIISSTVNQEKSMFQELYSAAEMGTAPRGMASFLATWKDHPHRDEMWADLQRQIIGKDAFFKEYMCTFE